jgi:hypothetical protein
VYEEGKCNTLTLPPRSSFYHVEPSKVANAWEGFLTFFRSDPIRSDPIFNLRPAPFQRHYLPHSVHVASQCIVP